MSVLIQRSPKRAVLATALGAGLLVSLGLWAGAPAADLRPDEQVVFYPTAAWRAGEGWEAELHGCIFELEPRPLAVLLLRQVLRVDEHRLSPQEQALFTTRVRLLLRDHEGGRTLRVQWIGPGPKPEPIVLGPSQGDGHVRRRVQLSSAQVAAWADTNGCLRYEAVGLMNRPEPPAPGRVHLIEPTGWSVISDIDDTIKITGGTNWAEVISNTFWRPFQPVPGMAKLYRTWAARHRASFHYVSASVWQLYEPLAELVERAGFPAGTFTLRTARVSDGTVLGLLESPQRYKTEVIELLLSRWPQRRFVLVGNSTEQDPEVYGALARRHPQQVARIFIRDVMGEQGQPERYRTAFAGLPPTLWRVFKDPEELAEALP